MEPFRWRQGSTPLLVSMPHTGTHVPDVLLRRMTPAARALPDTDWHLERLYDFVDALGASLLIATHSRYVVDLNRPPDDANLYPGQDTTPLVPLDTFTANLYMSRARNRTRLRSEKDSNGIGNRITPSLRRRCQG